VLVGSFIEPMPTIITSVPLANAVGCFPNLSGAGYICPP